MNIRLASLLAIVLGFAAVGTPGGSLALDSQTFVVNSAADTDNGACTTNPGGCTLREAINAANSNGNPGARDNIDFDIPGDGVHTINVGTGNLATAPLPPIFEPVSIDGSTQPGASCEPRNLLIEINGVGVSGGAIGLLLISSANVIQGFSIGEFGTGIQSQSGGSRILCNHIGIKADGASTLPNRNGLELRGAYHSVGDRRNPYAMKNLISGNECNGLIVSGGHNGIFGNYVGVDLAGQVARPNGCSGVMLTGELNDIGGPEPGAGNTLSGNRLAGLFICTKPPGTYPFLQPADRNQVQGNRIGTSYDGALDIPNYVGIEVIGSFNLIGGSSPDDRNIVSGNQLAGMRIISSGYDTPECYSPILEGNVVSGNFIGLDASGSTPIPNAFGISVSLDSRRTTVGGASIGERNVVSGNRWGITMTSTLGDNFIVNNIVGLDASGSFAVRNSVVGIGFSSHPGNTNIDVIRDNLVSGNGYGIGIGGSASFLKLVDNTIGLDSQGTASIPNDSGIFVSGEPGLTIGSRDPGERNIISGNYLGIELVASDVRIIGNFIGVLADGVSPAPNTERSITQPGFVQGIRIGGIHPGEANTIVALPDAYRGAIAVSGQSVGPGDHTSIRGNSLKGGAPAAIDLSITHWEWGPTPNDPGDGDVGANGFQNYPVFTAATSSGGSTRVTGQLDTLPGLYFVDFFASGACSSSGFGPGERFLGWASVSVGEVAANFSVTLGAGLVPGEVLTATASRSSGDTSEFSACFMPTVGLVSGPILSKLGIVSVTAGAAGFDLPIFGEGFNASDSATWNGAVRPATFISANELRVHVSPADVQAVQQNSVGVLAADGTLSNALPFEVLASPAADADGNGCVGVSDVLALRVAAAGMPAAKPTPCATRSWPNLDPDYSGATDAADALYILRVLAGILPQ